MRPAVRRFSRWLVLAIVVSVAVAGWSARAEVAAAPQTPDVAALQLQIQALEARLKKLEDRLEKPLTVKAPFTVTTDAGQAMFAVKAANGPELTLGSEAAPTLRVSHEGGRALLVVREGQSQSALSATANDSIVMAARGAGQYARLLASNAVAVETVWSVGQSANLVAGDAVGTRLKLSDGGKQIFRVQATNGTELVLGEDAAPALKVAATPQDTTLRLQHGNSSMVAAAKQNGDVVVSALSQTGNHAALQALAAGPNVVVDSGGQNPSESAFLSLDKTGPRLTLSRSGKMSALLGSAEGMHTGLRIYDPQGSLALAAGLGIGAVGRAGVTLWRNDEEASATLSTTDAGEGLLEIYRPGKQLAAQLGRTDQTKGTALRIYDTGGAIAVGAGLEADGSAGVLVASQGKYVAGMTAEKSGYGRIDIANNNNVVVSINNSSRKGDGVLEVFDRASSTLLASVGSGGGEGLLELFRPGGKTAAQIGAPTGKGTALRIFDPGGNVAVGAGIDTLGQHTVTVARDGQQVARLVAATSGSGAVDVLAKGKSVASMGTADDGRGVFNIFSGGTAIAALTLGANGGGLLQLGNAAGTPMVEAGTTQSGVGLVRTGPMALPMLPGIPGSFILGKR